MELTRSARKNAKRRIQRWWKAAFFQLKRQKFRMSPLVQKSLWLSLSRSCRELKNFSQLSSSPRRPAQQRNHSLCWQRNRPSSVRVNTGQQALWKPNQAKETNQERARTSSGTAWLPRCLFAHKLRCLHFVGRCWRKPGRDIKNLQSCGQEQPGEQEYDHYCKHCWSKGALPGQDSEQGRTAEDSGSSSTDAWVKHRAAQARTGRAD